MLTVEKQKLLATLVAETYAKKTPREESKRIFNEALEKAGGSEEDLNDIFAIAAEIYASGDYRKPEVIS